MTIHNPPEAAIARSSPSRPLGARLQAGLRRGTLTAIGGACLGLGMMLTATLVRPEMLVTLDTAQLVGILVLLTCPALTRMAIGLDRAVLKARAATHDQQRVCAHARSEVSIPAHTRAALPTPISTPTCARITPHSPHSRGTRATHHTRALGRDDTPGVYDLAS